MGPNTANSIAAWIRAALLVGMFAAGVNPAQAQNLTFFREYKYNIPPPLNNRDGFASDGRGGLYSLIDDTLRKYDSGGTELWTKQIGIFPSLGEVEGLAANAGGVFVAGGTGSVLPGQTSNGKADAFVRRYDPDGRELWTRQFGTPENDFVHVLAADATGVYVAGVTWPGGPAPGTQFVSRFDASGNQLWTRPFTGGETLLNAAADSAGVYIASIFGRLLTVTRLDVRGNEVWTRRLAPWNSLGGLGPVAAAGESGVYVLFGSLPSPGSPTDFLLRRYDQTGSESWTRPVSRQPLALAADSTGVFVLGGTDRAIPGQCYAGIFDLFLTRYTLGGDQAWTRQFGTAWVDNLRGVAVDSSGVYVYGTHQLNPGPDGSPPPTGMFLAKFEKSSSPIADSRPRIVWECVLNAASYLGGGVAPGEIVTIFGSAMGPVDLARLEVTPDGRLPATLAGVRILFDGEPAPLIYVSEKQSSAIVPYGVAGKATVDVQVEYKGVLSSAVRMAVLQSRLGVFTLASSGSGQAAIVNEDGTINSPSNPAARGSVVSIYATGAGLPEPAGGDNRITGDLPPTFKSSPYVRLASDVNDEGFPYFPAEVLYYGVAPRSVPGLAQINAKLPLDVPPGETVPLFFGFSPSTRVEQTVTIAIR